VAASASLHEKNTFLLYVLVVGVLSGNMSHDDITTFTVSVDDLSPLSPPSLLTLVFLPPNHSKHTYYFYLFLYPFFTLFRKRYDDGTGMDVYAVCWPTSGRVLNTGD